MTQVITIAAVGDILMWERQIAAARVGRNRYSFDAMFAHLTPYLHRADLTIGNLETPLAGRERRYQIGTARRGFPRFNCPDELAATLKRTGFNVLTTANNHCLDRGVKGLTRTLDVLDRHEIAHTGTFRTQEESKRHLILEKNGIKVGIVAYTYGTNKQSVPISLHWMVNMIDTNKMMQDIAALRPLVDLVVVCPHFGREFSHAVTPQQRTLVTHLFHAGADLILGAHPHVIQPVEIRKTPLPNGTVKQQVVAYSLGNCISERITIFPHTECGAMLYLTVQKDEEGNTRILHVSSMPIWTQRGMVKKRWFFRVLPLKKAMTRPDKLITRTERIKLRKFWSRSRKLLGATRLI